MDDAKHFFTADQQPLLESALDYTGLGRWAGLALQEARSGFACVVFKPRPEMLSPWGTLNGGLINSLVEVPSFIALLTQLAPGEFPVTNDIFLQHVRPLPGDCRYEMTGTLLRRGKTMAWTDVVVSAGGKVASYARITKSIVARPV